MPRTILARTTTRLAAALLLAACSEPPAPTETPATPDQLAKIEQVVERFPAVTETYEAAKSDGVVSEQEIIEILQRAQSIKDAQQ